MKRNTNSSNKTRRLVLIGALGGISIFLGISGLGLIRLPIFSLTIMHIPVIIGALYFEINPIYEKETREMLEGLGFKAIDTKEDAFGKQRMMRAGKS